MNMPQPPAGGELGTAAAGFHDLAGLRPGRSPKAKPNAVRLSPQAP